MGLKTIKEFCHKNNLGSGLSYSNGQFKVSIDPYTKSLIDSKLTNYYTKTEVNSKLTGLYKIKGSTTPSAINSMSAVVGDVYNMTLDGTITNGISGSFSVLTGDNIVYTENGWDKLSATAKMALEAGDNISIEDNVISALGYTYNAEKNSFSVGGGTAAGQNSYAEGSGSISTLTGYNWDLDSTSISFDSAQSVAVGSILKIENNGENLFVKVTAIGEDKLTITVDTPISLECDENSNLSSIKGIAYGESSHVEGLGCIASGKSSHAEGQNTTASQLWDHAEGQNTIASGGASHAEGSSTIASGTYSHAEGFMTKATGSWSHAEGANNTTASGSISHAEGDGNIAAGYASHAEGCMTEALGGGSHAEGAYTTASNDYEHAQGCYNISNKKSNSFGDAGNTLHSIGIGTSEEVRINAQEVMQNGDHYIVGVGGYEGTTIVGAQTLQAVINSKVDKEDNKGLSTEDYTTEEKEKLSGIETGAQVNSVNSVNGQTGDVVIDQLTAGNNINIENNVITAKGYSTDTTNYTFATGYETNAIDVYTHAEGFGTKAQGSAAHAEGCKTITTNAYEHALGGYNISNTGENQSDKTLHSIGIGNGEDGRKNAHEVMLNGDTYIIGIGGYTGTNPTEAKTLLEVITEILSKLN